MKNIGEAIMILEIQRYVMEKYCGNKDENDYIDEYDKNRKNRGKLCLGEGEYGIIIKRAIATGGRKCLNGAL